MKKALIDGDVLHHWSLWQAPSLKAYQDNVLYNINQWMEASVASSCVIAIGGQDNFRKTMYSDYKETASRAKARKIKVPHAEDCLDWLRSHEWTVVADNIEADDILAIEASKLPPEDAVIITVDKDLLQVPAHHFNPRMSNLFVDPAKAFDFFKLQLFMGDAMDRIPGLPGVGPAKAAALLQANIDPIDAYKDKFGKDWEENFLFNGSLLFLLRTYDDSFSIERYEELKEDARQWSLEVLAKES